MPIRSDQWGSDMDDTNTATKKFKKELNSGIVALTLLSVLDKAAEPMYGYQIAKEEFLLSIMRGVVTGIIVPSCVQYMDLVVDFVPCISVIIDDLPRVLVLYGE